MKAYVSYCSNGLNFNKYVYFASNMTTAPLRYSDDLLFNANEGRTNEVAHVF